MGKTLGVIGVALLLLLLVGGCSVPGSEEIAATAVPTSPTSVGLGRPSVTPPPSDTPQPTDTPLPSDTPTPSPSPTLVPTLPPATPVPSRTPPPGAAPSAQIMATIEAIEFEMEALRGLEEMQPMTRTLMTREELARYLEQQFDEDYPPQEVAVDTQVMAAFDFVSEDIDLRQVLLDLYSSQVLGMYDQDADTFFVVSDGAFDLMDRLTLAHEYVHGLQDQAYELDSFVDEDRLNDDQFLARLALIEGDATLSMTEYFLAHMMELSQEDLQSLQEEDLAGSDAALAAAPIIIRETLNFPYIYGTEFVAVLQEGGWHAVDDAYRQPPQSTEQILHPQKYLEWDEPQLVSLPPLTDTLGAGWAMIDSETLGEFQTILYLAQQMDQEIADQAAAGWDGDRYAVYGRDGAKVLVLATVWDSEGDREEFVAAYRQYATGRYGQDPSRTKGGEVWWETAIQVTVLSWQADRTLIVVGPDVTTIERVLAAFAP